MFKTAASRVLAIVAFSGVCAGAIAAVVPTTTQPVPQAGAVTIADVAPIADVDADGLPNSSDQLSDDERNDPRAVEAQRAVDRGLAYLAATQNAEHGFWINDAGYKLNYDYTVTMRDARHPGVTSICCLAFMANGHLPGRGRYGEVVRKGMDFVLSCVSDGSDQAYGYVSMDGTRMYSHAFATLFLAEVLGMSNLNAEDERRVREGLRAAVNLIAQTQNQKGAWRYQPLASDSDMSVCVCQLQALRAARGVGIIVAPETIDRAREYVSLSYRTQSDWTSQAASFIYQHDEPPSRTSWTLTAAGIVAMQSAGNYASFTRGGRRYELKASIEYLKRNMPLSLADIRHYPRRQMEFGYFYGHYYAAQAVYQYDRDNPGEWAPWIANVREKFILMQQVTGKQGYWMDEIGRNYATAMACLVLQLHHEYLPIFHK